MRALRGAGEDYLRELHTRFAELDLNGADVLLDCANGATFEVAPEIFRRLGANVTVIADEPDGRNINDGMRLDARRGARASACVAGGHDVGFAFDGDGDRVLAVDVPGAVVDGDELLALAALHLRERGRLERRRRRGHGDDELRLPHGDGARRRSRSRRRSVGDRYVLEELRARGWALGGEQSGHIIELGFNRTGDGVASALLTLEAIAGGDLAERQRDGEAAAAARQRARARPRGDRRRRGGRTRPSAQPSEQLDGRGRVLVRPSGTEPLVRVMVEAPSDAEAQEVCDRLVALVEVELG